MDDKPFMFRCHASIILLFLILTVALQAQPSRPAPQSATAANPPAPRNILFEWARTSRIRAAYMSPPDSDWLPHVQNVGMNTAMVKVSVPVTMTSLGRNRLAMMASQCHRNNLAFVPVINFWASEQVEFPNYRRYVDAKGQPTEAYPCPMDYRLYMDFLDPRLQNLADLKVDGIVMDLEFYLQEHPGQYLDQCYCDYCLDSFKAVSSPDITELSAVALRNKLRENRDLARAYYLYQRNTIAKYVRFLRQQAVSPNVAVGAFYLDMATWHGKSIAFYDGLVMGLGTKNMPALAFSESLYSGKNEKQPWQEYLQQATTYFKALPADVILVPGLSHKALAPDEIGPLAAAYAKASGGFWIFTLSDFAPRSPVKLKGTVRDYFKAYRAACDELNASATSRDNKP